MTGKRKGKQKYRSSEHKQKEQQLAQDWADLQSKYQTAPAKAAASGVYWS